MAVEFMLVAAAECPLAPERRVVSNKAHRHDLQRRSLRLGVKMPPVPVTAWVSEWLSHDNFCRFNCKERCGILAETSAIASRVAGTRNPAQAAE